MPITHSRREQLDAEFEKWLEHNPGVVDAYVRLAVNALTDDGYVGVGAVWEALRRERRPRNGARYALDNTMQSRVARRALELEPSLSGHLRIRVLMS